VPVLEASHLSEAQKRAYIIADNKLALNAGWDEEMLRVEFDDLLELGFVLDLTGFDPDEIAGLTMPSFMPGTEDEQGRLDELDPKWCVCPKCGGEFDLREQG